MYTVTEAWKAAYPGACMGILALNQVRNPTEHTGLEERKAQLEEDLRSRYAGFDRPRLKALPELEAYANYYKQFKKTYHVQLQLESVALKDKPLPRVAALVETMFMAELDNLLLTSGHDLDLVQAPVTIDIATGTESYVLFNGQDQQPQPGDMLTRDAQGILSSIIYGPDKRTRIRPQTQRALFTVYGPSGIRPEQVRKHMDDIYVLAKLVSPDSQIETLEIFEAN
jgi:DNA/RNA-binding domain of Phe-tRNA-synthetase-like protein